MLERLALASLLCFAGSALAAGELRTLFHSVEDRDQLERDRRGERAATLSAKDRAAPAVTGFVRRSDGHDTVWLDGRALTGPEATRLSDPAKLRDASRHELAGIEVRLSR